MEIKAETLVKMNYKGTLTDGSVFDSSEGREPLEFVFGMGMIIPGLEKGIEGLKTGDKKTVEIKSEEAYGPRMDEAMQEVPRDQLPKDVELKEGMQLAAQGPQGVIPVVISEVKEDSVIVDFNHPLAGKDLVFEVEITEVRESTPEDLAKFMPQGHDHEHGDGCCGGSCSSEKEDGECCGSGACSTEDKKAE